ncbi:MAG: hypothetical protein H6742_13860 [Alphaproteobacteria bacterium]|nr:hypothetical protein [Alphaproteobacteria bacterium]
MSHPDDEAFADRPTKRPYARIERERRFSLRALPDGVDPAFYERLRDTYIDGTQLRLRRVEAPDGSLVVVKLGQKRPDPARPDSPRHRQMTTFYLRPDDEAVLAALPGRKSVKRRYKLREQGWTFCIDVYEAPAAAVGILVAEVECDDDDSLDAIRRPAWAEREVTALPEYSGVALAAPG